MPSGVGSHVTTTTKQHKYRIHSKTSKTLESSAQRISASKQSSGGSALSRFISESRNSDCSTELRSQRTLTQIDFIPKPANQELDDDDDLNYISAADGQANVNKVNKPAAGVFDPGHCQSVRGCPRQDRDVMRQRITETETLGRRNTGPSQSNKTASTGKHAPRKKKKKKKEIPKLTGSNGNSKKKRCGERGKGRNKTLTQMDFVQRWVKLESDDSSPLDYIYYTPRTTQRSNSRRLPDTRDHGEPSAAKRRRLNEDEDLDDDTRALEDTTVEQERLPSDPVTPRGLCSMEVPSSQSPESPGLAIISSSQFRRATRFTPRHAFTDIPHVTLKGPLSPCYGDYVAKGSDHVSDAGSTIDLVSVPSPSPKMTPRAVAAENTASWTGSTPPMMQRAVSIGKAEVRTVTDGARTVVYGTDSETDSDDSKSGIPSVPMPATNGSWISNGGLADEGSENPRNDDTEDFLPVPHKSNAEFQSQHSEPPASSEASVCYRRMERFTQFPLEPVPKLSTQSMIELFPDDSCVETVQVRPEDLQQSNVYQLGINVLDVDNLHTEVVFESSPAAQRSEAYQSNLACDKQWNKPVIQVESSQPADRFKKTDSEGTCPRGILSRREILSSSVMESIPVPQFLMTSSQDSIGEPYIIPEA